MTSEEVYKDIKPPQLYPTKKSNKQSRGSGVQDIRLKLLLIGVVEDTLAQIEQKVGLTVLRLGGGRLFRLVGASRKFLLQLLSQFSERRGR